MINFVPASSSFKINRSQFFSPHLYEDFGPDYGSENAPQELLVKYTDRGFTLENEKNLVTPYIKKVIFRSKVQNYARKMGIYTPVIKCGSWVLPPFRVDKKSGEISPTPFTGFVDIHAYNKKDEDNKDIVKYGYYGLEQCGNAHFCPVCASKLLAFRRAEIAHICKTMLAKGYQVLFLTHTAPHTVNTNPKIFVQKFNTAEKKKKEGKAWDSFKARTGFRFYIKAYEATVDAPHSKRKSGLHWHTHFILFFDRKKPFSENEAKAVEAWLSVKWYKCLLKQGLVLERQKKDVLKNGTDIQRPWTRNDGALSDPEKISRLSDYICKSLSFEMASHNTKTGRKANRMPHFELLRQVVEGEIEDKDNILPKLVEAFFRVPKIFPSPGLKRFCDVEEIEDEDILHGKRSIQIYTHPSKDESWLNIVDKGRQGHVIEALNKTKDIYEAVDNVSDYFETVSKGYDPLSLEKLRE